MPALLAAAVLGCASAPPSPGAFYRDAAPLASRAPGDLLRVEPVEGAPSGAKAWRILHVSTGVDGRPVPVSGLVVVPTGEPPPSGRPVVAWAHPTTGVATDCAPSLLGTGAFRRMPGLEEMLRRGWVVAATDYIGLGAPGTHPYLVGDSEAAAVLDSVRAARRVPGAGAGRRFAVWGHSQGGHAALFAGQRAARYAPELELAGVAAAAPATQLATLLRRDLGTTTGKILASYALWSWSRVFDAPMDRMLVPAARPVVERVAARCFDSVGSAFGASYDAMPLRDAFLAEPLETTPPWDRLMAENSPGGSPAGAPIFIAQGDADEIVRASITRAFARLLCRRGEAVTWRDLSGTGHVLAGFIAAPDAVAWMGDRLAGRPPEADCDALR